MDRADAAATTATVRLPESDAAQANDTEETPKTTATLKAQLDAATSAALTGNHAIRCFARFRYKHESRASRDVIAWAEKVTRKLCAPILEAVEQPADGHKIQLNVVALIDERTTAHRLFDLFLSTCSEQARERIVSSLSQPVYQVKKRGDTVHVFRSKKLDPIVASSFSETQGFDKGPRPYFSDAENPPHYVDGIRLEDNSGARRVTDAELMAEELREEPLPNTQEPATSTSLQTEKTVPKASLEPMHGS